MSARLLALAFTLASAPTFAAEPLRVAIVAAGPEAKHLSAAVAQARAAPGVVQVALARFAAPAARHDVLVMHRGPGAISPDDAAALREFFQAGKGAVIVGAARDAWPASPEFFPEILGAAPGELFAAGAAMTAISLYPHAIFTGVETFETRQPMPAFAKLADDAQLIMEGVAGEATTPLAWLRRRGANRLVHLVPADTATLADPAFRRIVAQAVLWAAGRPIPGATAIVQRTIMAESHPGAFAITFPGGPGVCLDPVRGGINFAWDGDFADLRPRWLTKQGAPARTFGEVFYREQSWRPLRAGAPGRESEFRFLGYALKDGAPEFHWSIDGRDVFETLTASADGAVLTRRFRVGAGSAPLWLALEPQPAAEISVRGLARDGALASFASAEAGEFTIEIRRKPAGALP